MPFTVPQPALLFAMSVKRNVRVFANQSILLLAAARAETKVVDPFFLVPQPRHRPLRIEALSRPLDR